MTSPLQELGKIDRRSGARVERGHHAALPYKDARAFAAKLRAEPGVVARCLEFVLLSACRTGEVLGAQWDEIDFEARTWEIPIGRLKTGKATRAPHVVPLSSRMLTILAEMREVRCSDFVFPGRLDGRPLGSAALLRLMRGPLGYARLTVHGLRSTFRDYAGDVVNAPWEVAEAALAHLVGSAVSRSYRRGDALEKRRELMESWAAYCEGADGGDEAVNVVPFARAS